MRRPDGTDVAGSGYKLICTVHITIELHIQLNLNKYSIDKTRTAHKLGKIRKSTLSKVRQRDIIESTKRASIDTRYDCKNNNSKR